MNDRVLLLSVTPDPGFGAEKVLASLLDALPEDFAGRCILLRPPGSSLARWAVGDRADYCDWPARRDAAVFNLLACFPVARALRAERIGLVHAWGARAFESAVLLGRLLGAPVSGTVHDHPHASFHSGLRKVIIRRSAPRLKRLVCVSHAVAEACRDSGLNADYSVIRNGLLPASPRSDSRRGGPVRVGFFGLYARPKGFETVRHWIEATGPAIEWHLYGEPAPVLRDACETLKAKGLSNILFHGWVDSPQIMDGIDIVLHASTEFDSYPTVLLEAARAGIPAVASNLGGSGEIIDDGVTGFLFSPSDPGAGLRCLRVLTADPALRTRMGAAARCRFESEFGISRMIDSYLALWDALLRDSTTAALGKRP